MNPQADKRREPRRRAEGTGRVRTSGDPRGAWLEVQLVDVSDSGFRLAHLDTTLAAGQVLDFAHSQASGTARVIWNRIDHGRVESGCVILTRV